MSPKKGEKVAVEAAPVKQQPVEIKREQICLHKFFSPAAGSGAVGNGAGMADAVGNGDGEAAGMSNAVMEPRGAGGGHGTNNAAEIESVQLGHSNADEHGHPAVGAGAAGSTLVGNESGLPQTRSTAIEPVPKRHKATIAAMQTITEK